MASVDSISTLIHELSLLVSRAFSAETRAVGLTRTQWMILYTLHREGDLSQSEIATKLSIAKQPLGKVVEQLEAEGWVKRRRNALDKRAYVVSITGKVNRFIPSLYAVLKKIDELALEGVDEANRELLLTDLQRMKVNLKSVVG